MNHETNSLSCLFRALLFLVVCSTGILPAAEPRFRVATFAADVTPPLGHRCMGILPTRVTSVADPLEVRGLVILGAGKPIVLVAFDWCEIRNDSFDRLRKELAAAIDTEPRRVLVTSLHQHDAPVVDSGAQRLLDQVGLPRALHDPEYFDVCVKRTVDAVRHSLDSSRPFTHLGTGSAVVEQIASNRRIIRDGEVTFSRGSSSGRDPFHANGPIGQIDPLLRAITFWEGESCVAAVYSYSTHPMSYYGRGEVSADFVGLARRMMAREYPDAHHIYVSGCSGDTTAGKFNDGSNAMRPVLASRLFAGMRTAWENTERRPAGSIQFRSTTVELPFRSIQSMESSRLKAVLRDDGQPERSRILAAMALSSRQRVEEGRGIDLPCIDLETAQIVLFPAEAFVGYQLKAQELVGEQFVMSIGYGECWPGYIPTAAAFADGFDDSWLWVDPGCESRLVAALERVLRKSE